jgi:5-methylcytosine-specific restriction endonuclease McrA
MSVNEATRKLVRERAKYLCEYCHSSEDASAAQFAIDHIIPQSLGGSDEPDNLALACQRCNGYRYNFTTGIDPQTQKIIPLFNPRQQNWSDHFIWTVDGLRITGITSINVPAPHTVTGKSFSCAISPCVLWSCS